MVRKTVESRECQVKRCAVLIVVTVLMFVSIDTCRAQDASSPQQIPVKGMVTMVDVGADKCIPCKMMAPILKEVEDEYKGKAAIAFVDVWKFPEQANKFSIQVIPTQIFYDKSGMEALRYEGFMDKEKIVAVLENLGVKK